MNPDIAARLIDILHLVSKVSRSTARITAYLGNVSPPIKIGQLMTPRIEAELTRINVFTNQGMTILDHEAVECTIMDLLKEKGSEKFMSAKNTRKESSRHRYYAHTELKSMMVFLNNSLPMSTTQKWL